MRVIRGRGAVESTFTPLFNATQTFTPVAIPLCTTNVNAQQFYYNQLDLKVECAGSATKERLIQPKSEFQRLFNENINPTEKKWNYGPYIPKRKLEAMKNSPKNFEPLCILCRSNGEPESVYKSHCLRTKDNIVSCPILRKYNCPICNNGGGDYAHTLRYCPKNVGPDRVLSVMEKIKNGRKASGKKQKVPK